ncbi:MAG TPA: GNAT family N-acetyltransferase [Acidimicrobiales bacterium]|nr:GNAT family N-acetyltransferase [Acidimicrobiales bacterium]
MPVRDRRPEDLDALVRLAAEVHALDGYPIYLPTDLGAFVYSKDTIAGWVAEEADEIVGHVALHRRSWEGVMRLARDVTGLSESQLGVVARLLVSPTARRQGLGAALLAQAERQARKLGLQPILDVATQYSAAVRLYERSGWRVLGTVKFPMPDNSTVDEYVFAASDSR